MDESYICDNLNQTYGFFSFLTKQEKNEIHVVKKSSEKEQIDFCMYDYTLLVLK